MGLSEFLSLVTPQTAMGIAISATIVAVAFWKEWIVPGPRYRAALKAQGRAERREHIWQRLYMVVRLALARKLGTDDLLDLPDFPNLDYELEDCE